MPIVLSDPSGLSAGITQAGSALGQGLAAGLERRAQSRLLANQQTALQQALAQGDLLTQKGQQEFLQRTTAAGIPTSEALGILDRAIKMNQGSPFAMEDPQQLGQLFTRLGIDPQRAKDYADLYVNLSQGGKTAFANMFIENLQRGQGATLQPHQVSELVQNEEATGDVNQIEPPEERSYELPDKIDLFQGLTKKEKVQREGELFKANSPIYDEIVSKGRAGKKEEHRLRLLDRINNSGKLPTDWGKLNVNWKTGEIRAPALANAETQQYVKLINEFTVGAKDVYGGRVTNFELQAFKQMLPTLANSPEGRRMILSTMKAVNELEQLYQNSLKQVYDKYGLRGVDKQTAEVEAEKLRGKREDALIQKLNDSVLANQVFVAKENVPEGHTIIINREGVVGAVPDEKLGAHLREGARIP